jgi:hypothetical protein
MSPGLAHQSREHLDRAHVDHDHLIFATSGTPLKLISRDLEASRHPPPSSPTTLRDHLFRLRDSKEFITLALEEAPTEAPT